MKLGVYTYCVVFATINVVAASLDVARGDVLWACVNTACAMLLIAFARHEARAA